MKPINLVFPHQLYEDSPLFEFDAPFYLIEETLFFNQFKFHKQKIAFHRASMKCYEAYLKSKNKEVFYVEAPEKISDVRELISALSEKGITQIHCIDPTDNWLQKRTQNACKKFTIQLNEMESPLFLNSKKELGHFFNPDKKNYLHNTFYQQERKKRNILLEGGSPTGGKWSFDAENRKKYPAKKTPPSVQFPDNDDFYEEAVNYVEKNFSKNYGNLTKNSLYPTSFETSEAWLKQFLEQRFIEFGTYEDAIVAENSILNHSVLTPMLNVGLLTSQKIVETSLTYAKENNIPINSTEGFIRQIIGWREFIRGIYETRGSEERTRNFWNFDRKIPKSFYHGTTGIVPIDQTIKKVLQTGYCHHIERLMILGSFMLLCEFDPDEVYQWFMELFIDAYDWVMVPNVYGMSQFADGGLMATKPYISGSNYVMKMSNYKKGDWQKYWDGLFWNFMDKHRNFLSQNHRLNMLVNMFDKMDSDKKETHLKNATEFLEGLD